MRSPPPPGAPGLPWPGICGRSPPSRSEPDRPGNRPSRPPADHVRDKRRSSHAYIHHTRAHQRHREVAGARVRVTASDRTDTVVLVEPINEASRSDVKVANKTKVEFADGQLSVKT